MTISKGGRLPQTVGWLKGVLFTGGLIATLAGTRLLGLQEQAPAAPEGTDAVTIVVPLFEKPHYSLPPTSRGMEITLGPITQAVVPQLNPVARTRSSR